VAWALKAADKKEQYEAWIIWRRGVFLGESLAEKPSTAELIDYWKRKMGDCERFLRQQGGKMLEKSFPRTTRELALVKEFYERLCKEERLARSLGLEKEFGTIGATGISKFCFGVGKKHGTKEKARNGYEKKLKNLLRKIGRKSYSEAQKQVLMSALRFTSKLLKATPLAG